MCEGEGLGCVRGGAWMCEGEGLGLGCVQESMCSEVCWGLSYTLCVCCSDLVRMSLKSLRRTLRRLV